MLPFHNPRPLESTRKLLFFSCLQGVQNWPLARNRLYIWFSKFIPRPESNKIRSNFFKDLRDIAHWCEKIWNLTSTLIRQNGESEDRCYKKIKEPQFSQKRIFLTLCFLVTSVFRFALLPYCLQLFLDKRFLERCTC